jgi:hypothetical protein
MLQEAVAINGSGAAEVYIHDSNTRIHGCKVVFLRELML